MERRIDALSLFPGFEDAMLLILRYFGKTKKPLPPVFMTMPGGVEPELFIDSFCDELDSGGYVAFSGTRRWLNMRLDFTEDGCFKSFELMLKCMHTHAGYCNHFHGVVLVDMTQWLKHSDDARFNDVLAYIHDFSDDAFFMMYVTVSDRQSAEAIRKAVSRWVFAVDIDIESPSPAALAAVLEDKLANAGYALAADARELLADSVEKLAAQDDFAGLREIDTLAAAISVRNLNRSALEAEHLGYFSADGEWLRQRLSGNRITMGFTGGRSYE